MAELQSDLSLTQKENSKLNTVFSTSKGSLIYFHLIQPRHGATNISSLIDKELLSGSTVLPSLIIHNEDYFKTYAIPELQTQFLMQSYQLLQNGGLMIIQSKLGSSVSYINKMNCFKDDLQNKQDNVKKTKAIELSTSACTKTTADEQQHIMNIDTNNSEEVNKGGGGGGDSSLVSEWKELELIDGLWQAGFEETEIIYKSSFSPSVVIAVKGPIQTINERNDKHNQSNIIVSGRKRKKLKQQNSIQQLSNLQMRPSSNALLLFDTNPTYVYTSTSLLPTSINKLRANRISFFNSLLRQFQGTKYEQAALMLHEMFPPSSTSSCTIFNTSSSYLSIGDRNVDLTSKEQQVRMDELLEQLKPWKKGPLRCPYYDDDELFNPFF